MTTLNRNAGIFFKTRVQTEKTRPNASYVRFVEQLPKSEAHEIHWRGEKWIVGRDQFRTWDEALSDAAIRHNKDIEEARLKNPTEPHKAMGISVATLKKRMKFVQQHLQKGETKKAL